MNKEYHSAEAEYELLAYPEPPLAHGSPYRELPVGLEGVRGGLYDLLTSCQGIYDLLT